ncbi:DNA-binding transcriptional regulator, LysR family [Ruegeria halocynthiae]|uniref:DNA-binding transcriptional regulator, LysR family n=1 Tax=Ruegeria halocynthiae TaxID=985054 RepID=A0A1H3A6M5_9RHOB|nr:LysR family transcriptional regulator [Ruegeria halocynthiae]SDX25286.1 DNA-binding transcriptional regulator, LysR family [Ruegeria halocynthiae]
MSIKALRAFRATLSEGSLAAAANILHLSQPAVSRLISGLEGELRLDLFDRSGRNLTPTPEGLAFYREAGRILNNLDEIPGIAAEIRAGRTQNLRIVAMPRIARALASPAVGQFVRANPDTNVSLDVRARREAGKWLAGREYDVGIGALPVEHPDIQTELLLRVRAQAIVPVGHPLAQAKEVSMDDLRDLPIIRLMHGLLLRDQLDDMFRSAGVLPKQTCEVASSSLACALVADGGGITIADELVATNVDQARIRTVPVTPERWMSFGLLFPLHSEPNDARDEFVAVLKAHVAKLAALSRSIELAFQQAH